MIVISSTQNQRVKNIVLLQKKAKERKEQKCFVIEGRKMFFEVLRDAKESLLEVFATEAFIEEYKLSAQLPEERLFAVGENVMNAMAETVEPQGVIASVKMPDYQKDEILGKNGVFLALDDIRDPGNLGTILRTAEAAGVKGVLMSGGTVDIYNPKVVRSTMGAIFRVPHFYFEDFVGELCELKTTGAVLYAAHLKGQAFYDEQEYAEKSVLLIGNEANGLSDEVTALSDVKVKIPMEGKAESLNAAVAAALLSYQACRQKNNR